jgi:hypothetical protein
MVRKALQYQRQMKRILPLGLLAITAFLALPARAAAQEEPPPADQEIIVERERIIDIEAANIVAQGIAGRPRSREPMARFKTPLCLSLAIDNPERGVLIGRRIIANARAAGLEIAKRKCRPNALVVIGDNMRETIEQRRRSGRRFFVRLKRHEIDRMMTVRDPVYVFHQILVSGRTERTGRLIRKEMLGGVVMMERAPSEAFTPEQVADYITLRLLAPTREMDELARGAPRTIMTLFAAPDTAPPEMSRLDRKYLTALYCLPESSHGIEVLLAAARAIASERPGSRPPRGGRCARILYRTGATP